MKIHMGLFLERLVYIRCRRAINYHRILYQIFYFGIKEKIKLYLKC
jgi:hypothetical protein